MSQTSKPDHTNVAVLVQDQIRHATEQMPWTRFSVASDRANNLSWQR